MKIKNTIKVLGILSIFLMQPTINAKTSVNSMDVAHMIATTQSMNTDGASYVITTDMINVSNKMTHKLNINKPTPHKTKRSDKDYIDYVYIDKNFKKVSQKEPLKQKLSFSEVATQIHNSN